MKINEDEKQRRRDMRQMGVPVNGNDEENKRAWVEYEGLQVLQSRAEATANPGLLLQVATGAVILPPYEDLDPLPGRALKNPHAIDDPVLRILKKHAASIKEMAEGGIAEAKTLAAKIPRIDPKNRLRPIHSGIAEELGDNGHGLPSLVRKIRKICGKIGERQYQSLPPEVKEGILVGTLVHPLAIKPSPPAAAPEQVP
jgi:hypothetical protein